VKVVVSFTFLRRTCEKYLDKRKIIIHSTYTSILSLKKSTHIFGKLLFIILFKQRMMAVIQEDENSNTRRKRVIYSEHLA
jgi:hypothetical protein